VPQAYFFSRDNEILIHLLTYKVREEAKDLQKKLAILHKQVATFPQTVELEIQSMVDFIERADRLLCDREK